MNNETPTTMEEADKNMRGRKQHDPTVCGIDFRPVRTYSSLIMHCSAVTCLGKPGVTAQDRKANTMTTFDKRQDAAEKKFAHDAELTFKATARRNKLLGFWVADKLGMSGDAAQAYARAVVMSDFEEAGDEDVFRKVRQDLDAAKIAESDHVIRRTMDELMAKAVAEIQAGI